MANIRAQIKTLHRADPFRPFSLVLDDGSRVLIKRPEHLGKFPSGDKLFFATPDDAFDMVDVANVKRVEVDTGDTKRRRAG